MDLSLSIYYTIPDTAFQVILRFVGAHNLEVIWRCCVQSILVWLVVHTRSEQAVFPKLFRKEAQSMLLLISAVCGGVYAIH